MEFKILQGKEGDAVVKTSQSQKLIILKNLPYEVAIQVQDLIEKYLHVLVNYAVEKPNCLIVYDADTILIKELPYEEAIKVEQILTEHRLRELKLEDVDRALEELLQEEEEPEEEEEVEEESEAVIEIVDGCTVEAYIKVVALEDIPVEGEDVEAEIPVEVEKRTKPIIAVLESIATIRQRRDTRKHDYGFYITCTFSITRLLSPHVKVVKLRIEIPELGETREITTEVKTRRDKSTKYISVQVRIPKHKVQKLTKNFVHVRAQILSVQ